MPEYIAKSAAMEIVKRTSGDYAAAFSEIRKHPAADVETVRHGRWLINSDGYYPYCSVCKEEPKNGIMTHYCPNCGADNRGSEVKE